MSLAVKVLQFREHAREHGLAAALRFALYREEEAVPVEKDLASLRPLPAGAPPLVDLGPAEFAAASLRYPLASRRRRADDYLAAGYRTLAHVRDGVVVADVWYVSRATDGRGRHPHLDWFGIELGDGDVYMFDMHVAASERGGGAATAFMSAALHHVAGLGYRTAHGYFAAKNTPALWVHRLLGFREKPRVVVRRLGVLERVDRKPRNGASEPPRAATGG